MTAAESGTEKTIRLPIEVVKYTRPPLFRWLHTVDTPAGLRSTPCEGNMAASIEGSLVELIEYAHKLLRENVGLRNQIKGMADRIAAQSEILGKRAEALPIKRGK